MLSFIVENDDSQGKKDFLAKAEFFAVEVVNDNLIKKIGTYEDHVCWAYFRPNGELVALSERGLISKAA